jgi:hypothetical protein
MRLKIIASVWFIALGLSPIVLAAEGSCCNDKAPACCAQATMSGQHSHASMPCCKDGSCDMAAGKDEACDMPCCKDARATHKAACCAGEPFASAIDLLIAMGGGLDLTVPALDVPVRQTTAVWFHRPVFVGRNILQGKFVIEHDTARMARGEPCTYIYAANDMTKPVVVFHCTHIDAARAAQDTVSLETLPDGMRKLLQFQFAGDDAAHGFPTGR